MLKKIFMALFLLVIGVGCTKSCQKPKSDDAQANDKETAAVVNGKSISLSKLEELHKRTISQMQKAGQSLQVDQERKIRSGILRQLVDDELINQKAQASGISVNETERENALEQYKTRMGGPKNYEALVAQGLLTEKNIMENLVGEITRKKLLEKVGSKIEISEDDIVSFYEANKKLYVMPDMVRARHILLKVANTDTPEKVEQVKKRALELLEEAKKPGVNFEEMAQKYSEGPSQKQGGDLGFFARGRMVKDFEDAAFNASVKTAVGPVKTDFGFHIIYVEEKKAAHTADIPEARDRIVESLTRNKQARRAEEIMEDLRKDAKVKILDYSLTDKEYADLSNEKRPSQKP